MNKKKSHVSIISSFILFLFLIGFNLFFIKSANAFNNLRCVNAVYASNPIIYAIYVKYSGEPLTKKVISTYIKIVNPSKYKHDRFNAFLWQKLYYKDKIRFKKLLDYISQDHCFKEYIKADIGNYNFKKHGFYLRYRRSKKIIQNGMKTDRNIDFIRSIHGNIYYLFKNLTVDNINAGNFNFIKVSYNRAKQFVDSRTGDFGHIGRSIFLEYYYKPVKAKNNILKVKIIKVFVYNNKNKSKLIGSF
ncbi:MAG: hypothetical protein ACYCTB_08060 [bacterium]